MATICRPLTSLTQKEGKEIVWSESDKAFEKIKHVLITVPILHPNKEKEFF